MVTTSSPTIEVLLSGTDREEELRRDVWRGLSTQPRSLPSKWLYDQRGCSLFEQITELPEYYPTRAERSILEAHADAIALASGAGALVELGSGTSTKTKLLIEALLRAATLRRFVALDVAEETLRASLATLGGDYPGVEVSGVVGDFERHLGALPALEDRLVAFLGSTIGNLEPASRARFLSGVAHSLAPGESLLVGTDLVKDVRRLVAAYDDPAGVTEAFEKNALEVVNASLGADFDLQRFAYRAAWSGADERIEMGVVSRGEQRVTVDGLGLQFDLEDGEEIRTEVSAKFRTKAFVHELRAAGFDQVRTWRDPDGDFALHLATVGERG